ncbi:dystroglycan isoform X5 [Haematobia irritans]|uniref:dystroglycan isoform X5 n=1 Tax=Haematobia irritans TaxID=7368 RepID=UPI003F4FE173
MMLPKLDLSIAPFRTRTRDTSETLAMATESMSSSRTRRWRCSSTLATTYPLVLLSLTLQLLLVLNPVVISNAERDFNFNDSQVPLLEPKDEPTLSETHTHLHQHHHHQQQLQQQQQPHQHQDPYALELSHCRYGDNELVLSLVLQNYNWHDLNESRKAKVMDKLSKFFAIPKEFIVTESASKHDLYEMQKESLKKGNNKCHTNNHRKLGRVDFIIGCHSKYFSITEPIVKQIEQQMKDGALDNITGEKFGWWVIWRKHYKTRAIRNRRQVEGSGTQYDEDGDEEDDYEYEDEEEIVNQAQPISSTSTTTTHNTYGQPAATNTNTEDDDESEMNPNKLEVETVGDSIVHNRDDITALKHTDSEPGDNILHKKAPLNEEIDESLSKLESVITKTIENTKHIEDIPEIVVEQPEDALLKEVLQQQQQQTSQTSDDISLKPDHVNRVYDNTNGENDFNVAEVLDSLSPQTSTAAGVKLEENVDVAGLATTSLPSTHHHKTTHNNNKDNHIIENENSPPNTPVLNHDNHHHHHGGENEENKQQNHHHHHMSSSSTSTDLTSTTTLLPPPPPVILIDSTTLSITPPPPAPQPPSSNDILSITSSSSSSSSSSSTIIAANTTVYQSSTTTTTTTTTNNTSAKSNKGVYYDTTLEPVENQDAHSSKIPSSTTPMEESIYFASSSINPPTSTPQLVVSSPASTTQEIPVSTSAVPDYIEPKMENTPPMIKSRLQKFAVTSGKSFKFSIPEDTFYDAEDMTNLRLELTDKEGRELKSNSWLQFNAETKEVYGLPLDDSVSKWLYRLTATDSGNDSVVETLEISVQQHRGVRTVNHEVNIAVKINEKNMHYIDWQMKLIKAIATTLGDDNTNSIVVREIRANPQDPSIATLVYFNETLPTSECPETELNNLVKRLDANRLSDLVYPTLGIKSITGQLIGPCQKTVAKPKTPAISVKNIPPVSRNQVDRVVATGGHLLVYKVPSDTFFDDGKLTLSLKTKDNKELSPRHWLQFDSKNEEFYGVPKNGDIGSEEYILEAEDAGGLKTTDALVVQVNPAPKRDYTVYYKAYLAIKHENFNADLHRKFVERIAQLFGDASTQNIQIRAVNTIHDSDSTLVTFYNTTLYKLHNRCPEEEMDAVRNVYLQDGTMRDRVRKTLGPELNISNLQVHTLTCNAYTDVTHRDYVPNKPEEPLLKSTFSDDYLYTIILPAIIIVTMIIVASIIACCLHRRRRKSGKMELEKFHYFTGDEEERKSFRPKGIPVIFQDELDEKPEIGNKSPIILKNEKPPLLPPSYNTSNMNGDNDCDEYVPPPAVVVGGREARGKSPATPSYRKPPPYVSP